MGWFLINLGFVPGDREWVATDGAEKTANGGIPRAT
jgi:hypothetical protein